MYCENCGKEIVNEEGICDCCNENNKKRNIVDLFKNLSKKGKIITGAIAAVIVFLILAICLSGGTIESSAKRYIRETKKIDNVQEINGVVCVAKQYYGHSRKTYGYVVLYTSKKGSEFAYFEDGVYKGNGYNGGEAKKYEDKTFYNLHALGAMKDALEYIQDENLTVLSCEKHIDNEEGVVYIKLNDFPNWINNK